MRAHRPTTDAVPVYTIGHSTLTLDELVARLRRFGVTTLADLRTIPRSRHNPQFDADALRTALPREGIRYVHLPDLGGLRHAPADAPESGWRNAGFRGFAAYMLTPGFAAGLDALRALTTSGTVALMCAEAVPWRCHRSLVADALLARGVAVAHILGPDRAQPHRLTPFARIEGDRVTYPPEPDDGGRMDTAAPFHLEATVRVLQRRPTQPVDVWDDGRYLRVLETAHGLALVQVEDRGDVDAPDVRFTVRHPEVGPEAHAELVQTVRRVLGLDVDPRPLGSRAGRVPGLRATARALRGMRPPRFPSLFEALANVLPFQQLSLDSGVATVGRLVRRFGRHLDVDGRRFHAFPLAEAVGEARLDALRRCGLSARKADALRQLARRVASGELTAEAIDALGTEEAVRLLDDLPGIGPWTAGVVLLRGFGRLDVFPPGDVGVARGLRRLLHLAPDAPVDGVVERFGDRRGYLYFLALGASLRERGLVHDAGPVRRGRRAPSTSDP